MSRPWLLDLSLLFAAKPPFLTPVLTEILSVDLNETVHCDLYLFPLNKHNLPHVDLTGSVYKLWSLGQQRFCEVYVSSSRVPNGPPP